MGLFNLFLRLTGRGGLLCCGGFLDVVKAGGCLGFRFSSAFWSSFCLRLLSTMVFNFLALFDPLLLTFSKSSTATYFYDFVANDDDESYCFFILCLSFNINQNSFKSLIKFKLKNEFDYNALKILVLFFNHEYVLSEI